MVTHCVPAYHGDYTITQTHTVTFQLCPSQQRTSAVLLSFISSSNILLFSLFVHVTSLPWISWELSAPTDYIHTRQRDTDDAQLAWTKHSFVLRSRSSLALHQLIVEKSLNQSRVGHSVVASCCFVFQHFEIPSLPCRCGATAALLVPASDLRDELLFNFLRQRLNIPSGINKASRLSYLSIRHLVSDAVCCSDSHTPNSLFTITGPGCCSSFHQVILWTIYSIYNILKTFCNIKTVGRTSQ